MKSSLELRAGFTRLAGADGPQDTAPATGVTLPHAARGEWSPGGDLFSDAATAQKTHDARHTVALPNASRLNSEDVAHIVAGMPRLIDGLKAALLDIGRVEQVQHLGSAGPLDASGGEGSLFKAFFGRDSGKIARHLQQAYPRVGEETILAQARLQGTKSNVRSEEEPGRILHEYRPVGDPIGDTELRPKWGELPYYGSVDATPNYINLVAEHLEQNGSDILNRTVQQRSRSGSNVDVTILQSVRKAAAWVERRLDSALGGGMVYVQRSQNAGIPFQSWVDAADSRFDETGAIIDRDRPHIPLQDQGYAYRALRNGAAIERAAGDVARAEELDARAATLRAQVIDEFWLDDLGVFAPTLVPGDEGHWRPMRIASSEAWALLDSRMLDGDDVAPIRQRLIANLVDERFAMIAKGGVRTKSANKELDARYWPGSYQNGSVWPHDTKEILDGLKRYGYVQLAEDLELRVLLSCIANSGFPEFVKGLDDSVAANTEVVDIVEPDGFKNRLEQPPQDPQGWTVSAVFGILFDHGIIDGQLRFDHERFKAVYAQHFDRANFAQQGTKASVDWE